MNDRRCPICSSPRLKPKPFGYSFNRKWLQGIECSDCKIIFIHPQPTQDELVQLYSKEYFDGDFRCGHAGSYFDSKTLESLADVPLLEKITKLKPRGEFLEIGCAGGAFLKAARSAGYSVRGVEFSDVAAEFARKNFGLDVTTGDVFTARFPECYFDVVFMGDVLEHLSDPVSTVEEIRRITKPDGILVIECPMQTNTIFARLGFLVYTMFGKKATVNLPPYHLFEYRPASMRRLLEQCGFSIMRTNEGIIPPGQITLRSSGLQRIGKKLFQYPNYLLTSMLGVLGDRIEMVARRNA